MTGAPGKEGYNDEGIPVSTKQKAVYGPEDRIFPSLSDEDLWTGVFALLKGAYPERVLPEHARAAFEAICDEHDEYMLFKDFYRKVRLRWLWERPALPRGVAGFE